MDRPNDPAKPATAPVPIWRCTKAECKAWIREELAGEKPLCPICKGSMIRSMKHLPKLVKKAPPKKKKSEDNPW
ncbi:cold-inducible protein YdjO-related protein [Gorillibacterium sp. sgz5001074]|uniref:cold-inducible protein YdjO-related protein n=1 Tax=Gorillibacterium sp. sgz5001074 TaxID=3446695 RepID=UPI003F664544